MTNDIPAPWRAPLLVLAFVSLAVGVAAGLVRLGWNLGAPAAAHGPLMISSFFGTVIGLERAVALGRRWAYIGPLASGLSGLAIITGVGAPWPAALATVGSLVFLAASLDILARQKALFTATLALGAACWFVGTLYWAGGREVWQVVVWWIAFLVFTIAGERLELSRFLPASPMAKGLFAAIVALLLGALIVAGGSPIAQTVFGGALVALALWLFGNDIARRTVRESGLTRFIAVCLLSGYAWLAFGGAAIVAAGGVAPGTPSYDAALHALLLGFVFAMVFGHAPIIFPAVLNVSVPWRPIFYLPLALLHASLAVRIAGDYAGDFALRRTGGFGNAAALALFVLVMVGSIVTARSRPVRG